MLGYRGASGGKTFDENGDVTPVFDVLAVRGQDIVVVGEGAKGSATFFGVDEMIPLILLFSVVTTSRAMPVQWSKGNVEQIEK